MNHALYFASVQCQIPCAKIVIGGIRVQMEKKLSEGENIKKREWEWISTKSTESTSNCSECNEPIIIEPFYCIMCTMEMCTRCFDSKNEICSQCVSLVSDVAVKEICERCNINEAIVNQPCDTCHLKDVISCKECLRQSKKGLVECLECYSHLCPGCLRRYKLSEIRTCEACGLERCLHCIIYIRDPDGSIRWICKNKHKILCPCHELIYQIPSRGCRYEGCILYVCESNLKLRACHNHVGKCGYCNQMYSKSKNDKLLGFKYSPPKRACKTCTTSVLLLFWVNKNQRNRLPKDVLSMIIKILI